MWGFALFSTDTSILFRAAPAGPLFAAEIGLGAMSRFQEHQTLPDPCWVVHVDVMTPAGTLRERRSFVHPLRVMFGRGETADVQFPAEDLFISSSHMAIEHVDGEYMLRDTGSRNGVFLWTPSGQQQVHEITLERASGPMDVSLGPTGPHCQITVHEAIRFADYMVIGELGEGGMATVFVARDATCSHRLLVLKLIAPSFLRDMDKEEAEAMLQEEARIAALINHPNVVNVYRAGIWEGTPYIAMEYLRGASLNSILRQLRERGQRCPYDVAAALLSQVCWGLHAAHEARDPSGRSLDVIHRDVTPSNIICSGDGDVKVIDFGVARAWGKGHRSQSGFVGKPAYASPEQIRQPKSIDRRSDLFATGVILYELCTGDQLFARENDWATMAAVLNDPIPPRRDLPLALNTLLQRTLSRTPSDRPATAAELATELEKLVLAAGGQHLARSALTQTLAKLGVTLSPPQARPLHGTPQPFPRPSVLRSLPRPVEPAYGDVACVSGPSVSPVDAAPELNAARPGQERKRSDARALSKLSRLVSIGAQQYRTHRCLVECSGTGQASYRHALFVATQESPFGTEGEEARPAYVHLIGGADLESPPYPQELERLQAFAQRYAELSGPSNPLGQLQFSDAGWPGGPFVMLVPEPGPSETVSALLAQPLTDEQRVAHMRQLVGGLARVCELFPGFVHGELLPNRIALPGLLDRADRVQEQLSLVLCTRLDWLLGVAGSAGTHTTPLSLEDLNYLAPECLAGQPPAAASDVYAIAAMVYQLFGGDLAAASLAVRDSGRLPPLPPSTAPGYVQEALRAALLADPKRRPLPGELFRRLTQCADVPTRPPASPLAAPPPGQATLAPGTNGRTVHIGTVAIDRSMRSGPVALSFNAIPDLLPVAVGLTLFRDRMAIEIMDEQGSTGKRLRIYPQDDRGGAMRYIPNESSGAFEVGNRMNNHLQRVEFSLLSKEDVERDLVLPDCSVRPPASGCAALFWTREPRSGDLHVCCVQVAG